MEYVTSVTLIAEEFYNLYSRNDYNKKYLNPGAVWIFFLTLAPFLFHLISYKSQPLQSLLG